MNSYSEVNNYPFNIDYSEKNETESAIKSSDKILNTKIYYLNKSLSKHVCVGISINDFTPRIQIGGQQYFTSLNEDEWNSFLKYQGVIANYFYSNEVDSQMLKFGDITLCFEKSNQIPFIKINKLGGKYTCLARDSVDNLWQIKDIVDYRINIIKKQGFDQYFNLFQSNNLNSSEDIVTSIYNILNPNQNPNSENVCSMLEMVIMYPMELESKLKKRGFKRKYYEENGALY